MVGLKHMFCNKKFYLDVVDLVAVVGDAWPGWEVHIAHVLLLSGHERYGSQVFWVPVDREHDNVGVDLLRIREAYVAFNNIFVKCREAGDGEPVQLQGINPKVALRGGEQP